MLEAVSADHRAKALAELAAERGRLAHEHGNHASGLAHAHALAVATDKAITALLAPHARPADWAVLAVGGYGRGELSPCSDIDLLVLSRRANREVERVAADLAYALWDAKLEASPSVRDLADALRAAPDDFARRTSYLQARHLTGDVSLSHAFRARYLDGIRRQGGRSFLRALLTENDRRHQLAAEAAHGLEPDLKDGRGGLRDVHSLYWAGLVALQAQTPDEMVRAGYLAEDEALELAKAHEFLLRLRGHLHYAAGHRVDRLYFAYQEEIAASLGYPPDNGRAPVERLMREINAHGAAVARATGAFWEHVEDRLLPASRATVWHGLLNPRRRIQTTSHWLVRDRRLEIGPDREVPTEPEEVLGAFAEAARRGLRVGHALLRSLRAALAGKAGPAAWNETSRGRFFAILRAGENAAPLLEALADCGLLELYLPEWRDVRFLAHHDIYHLHTVDRHSALVVAELNRLATGEGPEGELAAGLALEIADFDLLLLAGLLHDLGKGQRGDHSAVGAEIAERIARRMGLDAPAAATLAFLVRQHLLLAKVATRRDLEDPSLVAGVAALAGSADRLRMLYLLTIADSVATGPSAWGEWKASLLRELLFRALRALSEVGPQPAAVLPARREELRTALLDAAAPGEVDDFIASLPNAYVLGQPPGVARRHLALLRSEGQSLVRTQIERAPDGLCHELILITADRPGILWRICGVFALHGLTVLEARVYTNDGGTALDVFRVADAFEDEVPVAKWPLVLRDLEQALDGRLSLGYRLSRKLRPYRQARPGPVRPTRVVVDNTSSGEYTVVEVHAPDRLGLLYAICRALDELGLDIHLAKVSTRGPEAVDAFYVRDARGQKVTEPQRHGEIERAVLFEMEGLDR